MDRERPKHGDMPLLGALEHMTPIAGTNVFPIDFLAPDDGDSENATSVDIAFEALANRTAYLKASDVVKAAQIAALQRLPVVNFASSVAQAFVDAAWNPTLRAWVGIETTTNAKASYTRGKSWGANVISGADTLHHIASNAAGDMVVTTTATNSTVVHEYNAGTSTWARRTGAGPANTSPTGTNQVVYDETAGKWCKGAGGTAGGVGFHNAYLAFSADRVTWTTSAFAGSFFDHTGGIYLAAKPGLIVMVARDFPAGAQNGHELVWTSTDGGNNFTAQSFVNHGLTSGGASESLTYDATEALFMLQVNDAVNACKVYTSPDGVTWTARATSITKRIYKVSSVFGTWVAVLSTSALVYSIDHGATWQYAGITVDTPVALVTSAAQLLALCTATVFPGFVGFVAGATAL